MSGNFCLNEHAPTVSHALTHAMTSWVTSPPTMVWSVCPGRPCLTRSSWPSPNHLKKKRERKGFDQVKLWVWPKSQNFQNGPIPLSFSSTFQFWDLFLYLRLGNCTNGSISKNLTFAWILTKSQNFQNGPVPLSFLSTFWFWDPFLHSRLGNCANCPISRKLTFAQILTKSQNFQEGLVLHNFSCRFWFWGLFLHSAIQNCSNSVILQLLALMWTLTKNQDVQAKLVLFKFSHRFWLWNPFICFGLGNHLCDPFLWSTSSVQNLSSQDQDLRFIHLVRIPSGLFSRLHQGFPFKVQMKSHKFILNLKLHWVTSSTYHSRLVLTSLQPTIPLLVPNIPTYRSVPTSRESTILTKNS